VGGVGRRKGQDSSVGRGERNQRKKGGEEGGEGGKSEWNSNVLVYGVNYFNTYGVIHFTTIIRSI
jgi:hypothetical protein